MKKYLPLILLAVGLLVLGAVFYFISRSTKQGGTPEEETALIEVALGDRPVAGLTPTDDGHWLLMKIEKIKISATTLDYELLYTLPDGRTQGVPGSINLKGEETIERKLLLGSESSGKFRYDEGVEEGTLTLKFRNNDGKLVAKFATRFHLQSNTKELTSVGDGISLTLAKTPAKTFFVTMETFGVYADPPAELKEGPWGVFSSSKSKLSGEVDLGTAKIYRAAGTRWEEITGGNTSDLGIFIGTD